MVRQLEDSSSSSIRFRPHIEAGLEITSDLEATHHSLDHICSEKLDSLSLHKTDSNVKLEKLKREMTELTVELKSDVAVAQTLIEQVSIL